MRTNSDGNSLRFTYGLTNYNFGATTFTAEFWINFESLPTWDASLGGEIASSPILVTVTVPQILDLVFGHLAVLILIINFIGEMELAQQFYIMI